MLIQLSFDTAVLNGNQWYEVVNGVPTGGIDSVDCNNISLLYVLKTLVYRKKPTELKNLDGFVNDISVQGKGCPNKVNEWVEPYDHRWSQTMALTSRITSNQSLNTPNFWISNTASRRVN